MMPRPSNDQDRSADATPVRKAVCTVEEYRGAIYEAGGVERLTVLSSYTYIDDPGTTPMGPGRHVYTEWGTKAGQFVAESEEHNGVFTYRIPLEDST